MSGYTVEINTLNREKERAAVLHEMKMLEAVLNEMGDRFAADAETIDFIEAKGQSVAEKTKEFVESLKGWRTND